MFVDALQHPFADRTRVDGATMCLITLLISGTLPRLMARLWSDLTFLAPALAAVVPLVVFLGLVDGMLTGDGFPPLTTTEMPRFAGRVVGVASVCLFPTVVTVVAVGYVTATDSVPTVLTDVTMTILTTATPPVTVVYTYLFPAVTVVSIHEGLRAGLRRDALRGATSGTYFFAWVGAAILIILAWSALAATISRSVAALLVLGWCAYAHVIAVAPITEDVGRTTP